MEEYGANIRKYWLPIFFLLILAPLTVTVPHVLLDSNNPTGAIEAPELETTSNGLLLIILDGVGENVMLNYDMMPELNSKRAEAALLDLRTGPLTLSATCVSELMTGVPNSPIDGLRNFNLDHPGGPDPWTLAANDDQYSVGMVGSYVLGNMYGEYDNIEFIDTFQGHADYYEGDEDTSEILQGWLNESTHNVITAHYSGPDKVGHRWGIVGQEYKEKIRDIDVEITRILPLVPDGWTTIVTADHGMTDVGSHGSAEDVTRDVSAFIFGPDILPNTRFSGHQRDVPALMSTVLGLPFPIQLHGRVPVEALDVSVDNKLIIEQWNWEAAYQRQLFVNEENGIESTDLQLDVIDWTKISEQETFTRDVDVAISIFNWAVLVTLSLIAIGVNIKGHWIDQKMALIFGGLIGIFVISHATLSHSAMIPRAFGAACAVWLVAWSLGGGLRREENQSELPVSFSKGVDGLSIIFGTFSGWIGMVAILYLVFGTITQAVVLGCLIWAAAWSWGCGAGIIQHSTGKWPAYAPWIFAIAAFTFGSIRLWFALIPFIFIVAQNTIENLRKDVKIVDRIQILTLLILLFAAVTLVHRRIIGAHVMLDLVKLGWSSSLLALLFSSLMLTLASFISITCRYGQLEIRKSVVLSLWLLGCYVVTGVSWLWLEWLILVLILLMYIGSLLVWIEVRRDLPRELILAAVASHLLISWGVWASCATLLLISTIGYFWEGMKNRFDTGAISINNPKPAIALAVLPWIAWILWWTLLGQVNGIQTCFEGICPHPRELDPGSIIIKGGYFAAIGHPSNLWMSLMVGSPLVVASTMLFYQFLNTGMTLKPYIISQAFLILGCLNLLAFSPQYPRLVFALTWNVFFAVMQIMLAFIAIGLYHLKDEFNSTELNHFSS